MGPSLKQISPRFSKVILPAVSMVSSLTTSTIDPVEAMKVSTSSCCLGDVVVSLSMLPSRTRLLSGSLILCEKEFITSSFFSAIKASSRKIAILSAMSLRNFAIASTRGARASTPAAIGTYTSPARAVTRAMTTRRSATATGSSIRSRVHRFMRSECGMVDDLDLFGIS
ncbi:MAG: hypothetical protein BWY89_01563 [Bacteroidetes bacterium ADurb.BinA012]|nr:MAG: hypothetical protein BWY89_01563 [Bacteroidetes bacterium ADurb.BinA012]